MNKDVIQGVIALLDEADKQIEGLTPKKANALLICNCEDAVNSLREALAEQPAQQQEPYGWKVYGVSTLFTGKFAEDDAKAEAKLIGGTCIAFPLYTSKPASKPWVGLTDEDIGAACGFGEHTTASTRFTLMTISRAIEAKLRDKNT